MRNTAHQPRENRTITVDFHNEATYFQLLGNGKGFVRMCDGVHPRPRLSAETQDDLLRR